jgi:hypothetical protein
MKDSAVLKAVTKGAFATLSRGGGKHKFQRARGRETISSHGSNRPIGDQQE